MAQNAPVFHGIALAPNSYIENATIEQLSINPASQTTGGRVWVLGAGGTGTDQLLKYSYIDGAGSVQTATFGTKEAIDAEKARAEAAEGSLTFGDATSTNLTTAINTERTRAMAAEGSMTFDDGASADLTTAINTERGARITTDSSLQTQIDTILGIANGGAIDTFAEVVAAYEAADSTINGAISANVTLIGDEESRALAAETVLQTAIDTVEASTGLGTDGSVTFTAFDSASMARDLTTETSILGAIEAINNELKVGGSDALLAEETARITADNTIQGNLDTEEAARIAADGTLQTNITDEETARIAADDAIKVEVDAIETSLGTIVSATGVYVPFTTTNYLNANTSITQDITDLDAQVKIVSDGLAAEISATNGDVNTLTTAINTVEASAGLSEAGAYVQNTGANYIQSQTTLNGADVKLDLELKRVEDELTVTQTNLGLGATGIYTPEATANFISEATSLKDADTLLDAQVQANLTEITNTQSSAGLGTDGSYTANATSNYITAASTLKDADNKLDAQIKVVQDELDATQTGTGLGNGGAYTANATTTYLKTASTLVEADEALDAAVKQNDDDITTIQTSSGLDVDFGYTPDPTSSYISSATTLKNADSLLDDKIKSNFDEITATQSSVGLSPTGSFVPFVSTNYLDASTTITGGLTALDTALNALTVSSSAGSAGIQLELDNTQTSLGTMVNATNGNWTGWTGTTNYLDAVTSATGAFEALDTQVKTNEDGLATEISDRAAAVTAEETARDTADTSIVDQINSMRYSSTSASATSHVIAHNLASDAIIVNVWVDQGDGSYANDIVPIAIDSNNQFTVYLSEARAIRVSVMKMDDITNPNAA